MSKIKQERKAEFKELNERYFDLPDGAYFAVMAEHGYEPEDIIELSDDDE